MVKRMLMLAVILAFGAAMGCSTTQKWMAGGAVVGAAVGGVWAGATEADLTAAEGAMVGAVTGAAVGGLVGNIIEEKQIKEEIDRLKKEIADKDATIEAQRKEIEDLKRQIADLQKQLEDLKRQLAEAKIREFELSLTSELLFKPGSAVLSAAGMKELDKAAELLKSEYKGKFVMIEGHTDADPIKASGWKSNWELGAARALEVLHYLDKKGVDPAMLSAATFSKYQPVADNSTAAGKTKNRRAVIVVYKSWAKPEQK